MSAQSAKATNAVLDAMDQEAHQTLYGFCPGGGKRDDSLKRRTVRCPVCRRRLLLAEVHCIGGELTCYKIPDHKPKVKTSRRVPSRSGRLGARGK